MFIMWVGPYISLFANTMPFIGNKFINRVIIVLYNLLLFFVNNMPFFNLKIFVSNCKNIWKLNYQNFIFESINYKLVFSLFALGWSLINLDVYILKLIGIFIIGFILFLILVDYTCLFLSSENIIKERWPRFYIILEIFLIFLLIASFFLLVLLLIKIIYVFIYQIFFYISKMIANMKELRPLAPKPSSSHSRGSGGKGSGGGPPPRGPHNGAVVKPQQEDSLEEKRRKNYIKNKLSFTHLTSDTNSNIRHSPLNNDTNSNVTYPPLSKEDNEFISYLEGYRNRKLNDTNFQPRYPSNMNNITRILKSLNQYDVNLFAMSKGSTIINDTFLRKVKECLRKKAEQEK